MITPQILAVASDVNGLTFGPSSNIYNLYSLFTEYEDAGANWSGGVFTVPYTAQYSFNVAANGRVNTLNGEDFGTYPVRIVVYVNDVYTYQYELLQSSYCFI